MDTLLIFVKNPRLGRVKTRLAATIGPEAALQIYLTLLEHTRKVALGLAAQRWVCYSDSIEPDDAWTAPDFEKHLQATGDLGQRMATAFEQALAAGSQRVIIIGSDCAELDSALLQQAFTALERTDLVIGPAHDGGYYLLGMTAHHPALFEGVAWSTDAVRAQTESIAERLGLTCTLLPALADVDTEADWLAVRDRFEK
jgi:uncharacterized protein